MVMISQKKMPHKFNGLLGGFRKKKNNVLFFCVVVKNLLDGSCKPWLTSTTKQSDHIGEFGGALLVQISADTNPEPPF